MFLCLSAHQPAPCPQPWALTAVPLVLPVPTVVLPVAAEDAGDTAVGVGALELTGQADVDICGRGEEGRVTKGGGGCRGREGTPHPLRRSRQLQGLEQQQSSPERRLLWAEPPCPWSVVQTLQIPGGGGSRWLGSPLPQLASSLLSWQSLSPSQMKAGLVQMPVEHWNCPGRHLNSAAGRGASESEGLGPGVATRSLGSQAAPGQDPLATPALGTYDSPGARLSGPHNRPPCHTSTRRGCTCRSCTQTGGQVGARGVGGGLGNSGGFLLRGWDVSK